MSAQLDDHVWYNEEKFILIGCEIDKNIIEAADFKLAHNENWFTACYRGYTAEYFIENNLLFGQKKVLKTDDNKLRWEISQKLTVKYTGAMVIAKHNMEDNNRRCSSDFIGDYLEFDKAYELYFIDGELLEITDLDFAIEEWKKIKSELNTNDAHTKFEQRYETATKNLQYQYETCYKIMD